MRLDYALPKTGHPNCRRPDKVIDAAESFLNSLQGMDVGVGYYVSFIALTPDELFYEIRSSEPIVFIGIY
jgi:hypothetical protein